MAKQKITVQYIESVQNVYIFHTRRKAKLTDLYPQRALLEEARKNSKLIQANDWIDHTYYEDMVEKADKKNKKIVDKHKPRVEPKDTSGTGKSYSIPQTVVKVSIEQQLQDFMQRDRT